MSEIFYSIRSSVSVQTKIEGSRFIADAIPVSGEDDAQRHLERIRKQYFDATHHCFAYIIGADRAVVRYSDGGEPSGTAGVRIYSALQSKNLSDILVVITRYFGGTKLGIGGLGRAYHDSAVRVIDSAAIVSKAGMFEVEIKFPFDEINPVMNAIRAEKVKVVETRHTEESSILRVQVLPSRYDHFRSTITDASRARAECSVVETTTAVL